MKSRIYTENKLKEISNGETRIERRKDRVGMEDVTFWYEPNEGKPAFMVSMDGHSIYVLETGNETYKVSFFGGDALSNRPLKFKLAPS